MTDRFPVLVRVADPTDAPELARLLHDFNTEYDVPSPGVVFLQRRLAHLLGTADTIGLLANRPALGFGLLTLRTNVWFDGPIATLDELYVVPSQRGRGIGSALIDAVHRRVEERQIALVEINVDEPDIDAQRFYHRHGFTSADPVTGARAFYFSKEFAG